MSRNGDASVRLLYVSGTYAPGAYAGSELSAHTALRALQASYPVDVLVATDRRYADDLGALNEFEGIPLVGIHHAHRERALQRIIAAFSPHVIFTQPWWHDLALRFGKALGIPTVLRVPDLSAADLVKRGAAVPTVLVVQTRDAGEVATAAGCEAVRLPAFMDLTRAQSPFPKAREFITMFNPIRVKGGFIFREIAERMPDRSFAVVPGWSSLRDERGQFDPEFFARVYESQGVEYTGRVPIEADLSDLANVTVLEPRENVYEIYDQTRVLLVPSLWKEQFGRVMFEAPANGAAVIASGMESIRSNVGDAAMYVDDYENVDAWIRAIRTLDDPATYEAQCARGHEWVMENYRLEDSVERFYSVIRRLAVRADQPAGQVR